MAGRIVATSSDIRRALPVRGWGCEALTGRTWHAHEPVHLHLRACGYRALHREHHPMLMYRDIGGTRGNVPHEPNEFGSLLAIGTCTNSTTGPTPFRRSGRFG